MSFKEILQRLLERDPVVTSCFFFWDGFTLEQIAEIRRKDPRKAAGLKIPVCNTCRPLLLRILKNLYDTKPFNYEEKVIELYIYLVDSNKLGQIREPEALMGWLTTTAYYFFLRQKKKEDGEMLENDAYSALNDIKDTENIEDVNERQKIQQIVQETLEALPNPTDAKILEKAMEIYSATDKIKRRAEVARQLGMSVDAFNTALSRAKKSFREILKKNE
jgi:DNA-directed RNA polymerase specialized sigma24 family protein